MAVEEVDYSTLHQGNGVSGGVRESRSQPAPKNTKTKKKAAGSNRSITSFVQGVTLGAVLLIPVGVWCWVRAGDSGIASVEAQQPSSGRPKVAGKAKPGAGVAKRKSLPVRLGSSAVVAAPRITGADPVVEVEPPAAVFVPPVAPESMAVVNQVGEEVEVAPKEKKGVWRTVSGPFRGKSKVNPPQLEPDGR